MTERDEGVSLAATYGRVAAHLVGRERELTLVLAAVAAGRDLILEGPPGTSKSTLLRAITAEWGIPLFFVEGNADLTPTKLIGHHNPARVLREDYSPDNFVDGPLLQAMRGGGFLYIEEFNRAPEDTLNTLLTAMAERQIAVPTAGTVAAAPTFRVIASMNPYDNVGTTRLSTSVHDRICRLAIGYQDAAAERGIVALRAPLPELAATLYDRLVSDAVAVTRATREHPDIRQGSSVRGAIDLTLVAGQLLGLRGVTSELAEGYPETVYDAMVVALSGRIFLDETVEGDPGGSAAGPPDRHQARDAQAARDITARRGIGELASLRYRDGSDDIDLDRTVEQLIEHPLPEEDDIIVRERVRTRRSVLLLADVSGSMRGERVRTAAATVGALAAELSRDDLAVVAFWSDAAILSRLGQHVPPQSLLDMMLRIPAKGLTNIAFPLQVAARELARVPARDARAVLLSDCVHNAGPDPRPFAARLPRLDVLLDTSGEQDADLARDLARLGHGRLRRIDTYTDVAPALSAIFAR